MQLSTKDDKLWTYIILPAVLLTAGAPLIYGLYYTLDAIQPNLVADIAVGQVGFVLYLFISAVEWAFAISIIGRLRRAGTSVMALIAPQGDPWGFRWLPAISILVAFPTIIAMAWGVMWTFGSLPTFEGLGLWPRIFLVILIPITSGFCEELIWRGYIITRLQARRWPWWLAILASAISFALVHEAPLRWLDTFLIGIITGYYYTQERNLVPLMIAHAVGNGLTFGFFLFVM